MQKLLTFFSAKMLGYIRCFNDTLTNDIVSFEQLGPGRVANNADPPFRASDPEVIKLFFFMLNSAELEIFSVNKYENAINSWHFHIYEQRNFHA